MAEEGECSGGVGEHLLAQLAQRGSVKKFRLANLGRDIPNQGTLGELQKALGLHAEGLAALVKELLA